MDPLRDALSGFNAERLTHQAEEARQEYMTRRILAALSFIGLTSGFGALAGFWMGMVSIEVPVLTGAVAVVLVTSWYATRRGLWGYTRYILVAILFFVGVHGTFTGGGSAPLTLMYVVSIALAAILLGTTGQAVVVVASLVAYVGLAILHHEGVLVPVRTDADAFYNRLLIVVPSLISLAVLLRFLITQMGVQSLAILRARDDLDRSEAQYHTLFNAIGEGVTIADLAGTIVDVNPAACAQVGMSREELLGTRVDNLSARSGMDTGSIMAQVKQAHVLRYETLHRKKDGTVFPVDLTLTYAEIEGVPRILATARDISERVASEQALRESERTFRLLFDLAPYGFTLTDREGKIRMASQSVVAGTGRPLEELLGKSMGELGIIDKRMEREAIEALAIHGRLDKVEFSVARGDGTTEDLLCSAVQVKINGEDLILAAILDISKRKRAERLLAVSEQRYRALFEEAGDAILLMNDHTIVDCNAQAEQLFQRSRDAIVGHSPVELSPAEQPGGVPSAHHAAHLIHAAVEGHRQNFEWIHTRPDGTTFFADVSLIGLRSAGERLLLAIVRDISAQKEAAAATERARRNAEESSRAKSVLLMNLSHEFRTPLTGILGLSELVREETTDERLQRHIDGIAASGRRLLGTLETILKLAQLSSGDVRVTPVPVDVGSVVARVLERFHPVAADKGLALIAEGSEGPCIALADDDTLFAILTFLVDNAVKFTREGSVRIRTVPSEDADLSHCRIEVTDTGIGIPVDQLELIFEEFRQVSEGSSRRFEGSGLGLTVARKLVMLLKGTISVASEPGAGSSFTVRLPVAVPAEEPVHDREPSRPAPDKPSRGPLDVLIVEDNFINKAVMAEALKPFCRTEHARNGSLAIQMAREKRYHAILMDINLGVPPDGIQTTQEIRRLPGYSTVPIIAVTGYTLPGDRERLMEQGLNMYLPKPFDRGELQDVVKRALF